jgi:hypothetical protein
LSNGKNTCGCHAIALVRYIAVLVVFGCTCGVDAQLVSVERTVATQPAFHSGSHIKVADPAGDLRAADGEVQDGRDSHDDILLLDFSVQTATFSTTNPERLFGENVVYLDPSQEPVTEELNEFLPPDLSIPPGIDELPSGDELLEQPITLPSNEPQASNTSSGCADESIHNFSTPEIDEKRLKFSRLMHEPYAVYRSEQSMFAWMPGHGEDFGWFDWQTDPYLRRGNHHGLTGAFNIHWLAGPISSPLPPRLYDFALGYQVRNKLSDQFSYDLYTSIGAYSDFEASARNAIRFPGHAVGMFHVNRSMDFVFGVDYLDRNDIAVLPVLGLSLRDVFVHGLKMDLVFPRPRIDYMLSETNRIYLAGLMNGGTWQVRFPDGSNPVMSYRDLRLMFGVETTEKDGSLSAWEFGYVFDRNLEFNNQPGHSRFDDAFIMQWISRH